MNKIQIIILKCSVNLVNWTFKAVCQLAIACILRMYALCVYLMLFGFIYEKTMFICLKHLIIVMPKVFCASLNLKKQIYHNISWYYSILAAQGSCSIIVIRLRQLKTGKVGKLIFHNE